MARRTAEKRVMSPNGEFEIKATPAKAFFVWMITRDIDLADAILDLLDNCVDGARRMGLKPGAKPYAGYYAHIDFNEKSFEIVDNCGGIPKEIAEKYAFRFGRPEGQPDEVHASIGVYGIGMKRARFKMGCDCSVYSQTNKDTFVVRITEAWLKRDDDWNLTAKRVEPRGSVKGTSISVEKLNGGIAEQFKAESFFRREFPQIVAGSFGLLIERGFEIKINGERLAAKLPRLLWQKGRAKGGDRELIQPYVFRGTIGKVNVFLAVGFRDKTPLDASNPEPAVGRWEVDDAGWTIACNERIVVLCDKTRLTGWETQGVPRYHGQFRGIAGFVEFKADDARDLPMPTTKRGIDASSEIYLLVRDQMIQGLKQMIAVTNDWKGAEADFNARLKAAEKIPVTEMPKRAEVDLQFKRARTNGLEVATPRLPTRPRIVTEHRIIFVRPVSKVRAVAEFLFENRDEDPNVVGGECFDRTLRESKQ
jgi:hypothetical protein